MADDHEIRLRGVETDMAVIQNRLESGAKAFDSLRTSIEELNERTTPPSARVYISIVLTIVFTILGGAWTLSRLIGERATHVEVERALHQHRTEGGHPPLDTAIYEVKAEQIKQRTQLEEFRQQTDKKLDEIKDAVKQTRRR